MTNLLNSKTLSVAVLLFGVALAALLWRSTSRQLQYHRGNTIREAVRRNDNLVIAFEQYTTRTIQSADAILRLSKAESEKNETDADFKMLLETVAGERGLFNGLTILDEEGSITYANLPADSVDGHLVKQTDFFRHHQAHPQDSLLISKPTQISAAARPVIVLSRRLNKPGGVFGGIVMLQIDPATLTRFYSGANLREKDIISLVAPNGITYARRKGTVTSYGEDIQKSPLFFHLKKNPTGSYYAKDALWHVPTYFSYRQLPGLPVIATAGTAEENVLRSFQAYAVKEMQATQIASLLVLLFSVSICWGLHYRTRSTRRLKESETKYRLMFETGKDGIVLLTEGGTILDQNPAAAGLLKRMNHDGSALATLFSAVHQSLKDGAGSFEAEFQFISREQSPVVLEVLASAFKQARHQRVYVLLLRDVTEKKALQRNLLRERKRRQQQITKQVLLAQEREREVIGRELHDNINQVLTTVKLYLDLAAKEPGMAEQLLPKSGQLVNRTIREIRALSHELTAPTLGTGSLIDSIQALVESLQPTTGLTIRFCHRDYRHQVNREQSLTLYRIVQEQLNNIIKHARASQVTIRLYQQDHQTILTVADNGQGFDPTVRRKGIGLQNIETRAKLLSGQVEIITAEKSGCTLQVVLPFTKTQPAQAGEEMQ